MSERPSRFRPLQTLDATARLLRGRANRYAWVGLGIASAAIVAASLLVCRYTSGEVSWDGLVSAQQSNPALWLLDLMPIVFLLWGQYIGSVMSYQAGALVLDETRELRQEAERLQYELGRAPVLGQNIGLPNRHALIAAIDRQLSRRQQQSDASFSVMVLDTAHYQEIVQAHGEEAAHAFLTQLRGRLQNVIGEDDVLAHFGFDDFGLLMVSTRTEADAVRQANRIQLAMDVPLSIGRRPLSVRTTIGIACYPQHGADADTLLRHAETAKFAAIADNRDHLLYASEQDNTRAETSRLMAELHSALYNDGLAEEYVLQQALNDGRQDRLRLTPGWNHPRLGYLSEAQFIDLPDRLGLVHGLCLWLLRQSLERLALWQQHQPPPHLVLRLPARALTLLSLPDLVLRMLSAHDLPGSSLTLELPEAALRTLSIAQRQQLQTLRTAGVRLSLCGVGELGTSPLVALDVPLDESRLSGRITLRALDLPMAREACGALIKLLKIQQLEVVCSGLETTAQIAMARQLGAEYAEGSAVQIAQSPEATLRWLEQRASA